MSKLKFSDAARLRMDAILTLARTNRKFRIQLVKKPDKILSIFGLSDKEATDISNHWGIGPSGDCGADTCRLTSPCGWTICGKTTNGCGGLPEWKLDRVNPAAPDPRTRPSELPRSRSATKLR